MKYECPITYHSKDMANVKVFADRQTNRRTGQKLYAPDLSIWGHKNYLAKRKRYSAIKLSNYSHKHAEQHTCIMSIVQNEWFYLQMHNKA
jgi:hypothetical protein